MIKSFLWSVLFFVFMTSVTYSQSKSSENFESEKSCKEWHNKIISRPNPTNIKKIDLSKIELFPKPKKLNEQDFLAAVECLLQLEGNKNRAAFGGATNIIYSGSSKGASGPVEVAALYYISFLYHDKWDHGTSVNLIDKQGNVDTPEAIKKAYEGYRDWFKKIKEIGLEKARKEELDPLANSDVRWL